MSDNKYSRVIDPTNPKCGPRGGFQSLIFTDHRPEKSRTAHVYDNTKYRKFLQQNAEKLMNQNFQGVRGQLTCCVSKQSKEKQHKSIPKYSCGKGFTLFNN